VSKDILKSNFFELFELPVSYDVDLNQIQKHYMVLQKQVHPDKFVGGSDQDKRLSMQQTSWINQAQATLKDSVLRAHYLLQLKDEDENNDTATTMDAAFLMQQLEMRERLENIKDEADPLSALDTMANEMKSSTKVMMHEFSQSYQKEQFADAREWIRKLQFLQKAAKEINGLAADIEDELMS
jgi:molecular chaperone HscB